MSKKTIVVSSEKLGKALLALEEAVARPVNGDKMIMDATIQRFEFVFELFWKFLKNVLATKGVIVQFPKDVLKEAYLGKWIDQEDIWIAMLDDRNMTSHTYNADLADEIYHRIKIYFPILQQAFKKLS